MFADGDLFHGWRFLLVILGLTFGTTAFSATAELQLENELLLELRLDGEPLDLDILGYQRGEDILLSFDELTNGLGFPIAVDVEKGSAEGWYIAENRVFTLDPELSMVVSDGKEWPIADGETVMFQGGLFVETTALENWFPLRLSVVIRELYLDVETEELLPIQQRFERRERVVARTSGKQQAKHPLQENPYRLVGPHSTKLRLGYSTVRQTPDSSATYGTNYAALSRGDLGWMTSTLSLAGQSGESLTGARLKLERSAFDGPLGLNHIEVGDVDTGGFRGILLRGDGGRGEKGNRFDNETVSLEGSQLPDWDVELYQNDQLVMIQTTGPDGRYLFEDVPLQFGENRFELKFFGPLGEVESREEFHFLGVGMLKAGSISYEAAAVQNGRTVFGVNDLEDIEDLDSGIYSGGVNIGLSRNLTVGAGFSSVEREGERLTTSNASIGLSTSRFYSSVNYTNIPFSQNSLGTSLRTQLGNTRLNLDYTQFFDEPLIVGSAQKYRGYVGVTSSELAVPVKLEFDTTEWEDSSSYNAVIGTTVPLLRSGRFSSSLWHSSAEERFDGTTTRTTVTGGQSTFHTAIAPWNFRLSANYGFKPETELLELSADSSLRIDSDLRLDLSVRQSTTTDTTFYSGGIDWQLDQVAINARVSYDSNERWGGLITLSTNLVPQPGTLMPRLDSLASVGAGSVEVRVFEGAAGTEGEPIEGVGVSGVQAWRHASTDERGVAYLSRMPAYRQVDIELDEATMPEGDLRSLNSGVSIISRPGSYAVVEFPVIRTVELEGHVVIADEDGNKPVSRALVLLKTPDGEVVARRRTAFDGFFLFDGIEPGDYQMSLDDSLGNRLLDQPGDVTVLGDNEVLRGLDFTLRDTEARTIVLDTIMAEGQPEPEPISASPLPTLASAVPEEEVQVEPLAKPPADEGQWFVQLGAYGSRELAQASWERVSQSLQAFQGKTPRYEPYQNMTRLLVGPGRDQGAANKLCQQFKAGSVDCLVRRVE